MEYILRQHLAVGAEEQVEPQAAEVDLLVEVVLERQLADPEAEAVLERQLARPEVVVVAQAASAALAQERVVLAVVVKLAGWARQAQRQAALVQ